MIPNGMLKRALRKQLKSILKKQLGPDAMPSKSMIRKNVSQWLADVNRPIIQYRPLLAFIGFIDRPNDTVYGKDRLSFYARTRICAVLNGAYEMNVKPKDNWPMAYAVEDAPAVAGVSRTESLRRYAMGK